MPAQCLWNMCTCHVYFKWDGRVQLSAYQFTIALPVCFGLIGRELISGGLTCLHTFQLSSCGRIEAIIGISCITGECYHHVMTIVRYFFFPPIEDNYAFPFAYHCAHTYVILISSHESLGIF